MESLSYQNDKQDKAKLAWDKHYNYYGKDKHSILSCLCHQSDIGISKHPYISLLSIMIICHMGENLVVLKMSWKLQLQKAKTEVLPERPKKNLYTLYHHQPQVGIKNPPERWLFRDQGKSQIYDTVWFMHVYTFHTLQSVKMILPYQYKHPYIIHSPNYYLVTLESIPIYSWNITPPFPCSRQRRGVTTNNEV